MVWFCFSNHENKNPVCWYKLVVYSSIGWTKIVRHFLMTQSYHCDPIMQKWTHFVKKIFFFSFDSNYIFSCNCCLHCQLFVYNFTKFVELSHHENDGGLKSPRANHLKFGKIRDANCLRLPQLSWHWVSKISPLDDRWVSKDRLCHWKTEEECFLMPLI